MTAQSTIDLLRTRRSIKKDHLGSPGPTPAELEQLLEATIRVADHGKLGPWRLAVYGPEAQRELGELLERAYRAANPDAGAPAIAAARAFPSGAPVLIVAASKLHPGHKVPLLEQTLSGGALGQNLLNAAHALGYSASWLTGWAAYDATVKAHLGVSAHDHVIGFFFIGTPRVAPTERPRPTVAEVVTRHGP